MDMIITAIIIGFCVWIPFHYINKLLVGYAKFKRDAVADLVKRTHVFVRIEEVDITPEEKLYLIFNSDNGKFITQGSIPEIRAFILEKFKTKAVYLTADDGTITPLKPADII